MERHYGLFLDRESLGPRVLKNPTVALGIALIDMDTRHLNLRPTLPALRIIKCPRRGRQRNSIITPARKDFDRGSRGSRGLRG